MPSDPMKLRPSQSLQEVLARIREKAAADGAAGMPKPTTDAPPPRHWSDGNDQDDDEP